MKKAALIILLAICTSPITARDSLANDLRITNVSLEDRNITNNTAVVEFDIAWDNSWRDPTNFDAVWIILKTSKAGVGFHHTMLDACGINPPSTSPGTDTNLLIDVPCNDVDQFGTTNYSGAFIYRKSTGNGSVSSKNVRLLIDYATNPLAAGDTDALVVTVIGIEMVYIPEGPFQAGDSAATATFRQRTATGERHPWYIQSEAQILTTNGTAGSFYYASTGSEGTQFSSGAIFTIYADYPKGYAAFYCMKYPITEGQWKTFFDNIASADRDITGLLGKNSDNVIKRNTLAWTSGDATTNRPNRAMSYLSWMDLLAYLDWAALRPMTELEYEKISRGALSSVPHEYAWGTSSATAAVTFSHSPEDGTETITTSNANANYNSTTFSQGDDFLGAEHVQGPIRPGIFATGSSSRSAAGGGYYGVMDLSGNLAEHVVTVGTTTGTTYFGANGNGQLDETSSTFARELGWPGTDTLVGADGVLLGEGSGFRGGSWSQGPGAMEISDRSEASTDVTTRTNRVGGRGVRSVTPPTYATCNDNVIDPPEQCDLTALGGCAINCSSFCECSIALP